MLGRGWGGGRRIFGQGCWEPEMDISKPEAEEGGKHLLAQQVGPQGSTGRGGPGEGVEAGGLTELERWATALMCSNSSKMRSSSSSVR